MKDEKSGSSNTEDPAAGRFGYFNFTPDWLQWLNNPSWFLVSVIGLMLGQGQSRGMSRNKSFQTNKLIIVKRRPTNPTFLSEVNLFISFQLPTRTQITIWYTAS